MEHSHDVKAVWNWWPLNLFVPSIVNTYLNGYGINPITTYLDDLTFWPRSQWNGLMNLFFGWNIDIIFDIIGSILGAFTGWLEFPMWLVSGYLHIFRYFGHLFENESFYVVLALVGACAGLGYWAMDASGMMAEMMGGEAAAPADGAATA